MKRMWVFLALLFVCCGSVYAAELLSNAGKIRSKIVPAPTVTDDGKAIVYDAATSAFIYGSSSTGGASFSGLAGSYSDNAGLAAAVNSKAPINNPTFTGTVGGVTKTHVGLPAVTNDAQVKRSEMGAVSGVATLDTGGKVPASQLPASSTPSWGGISGTLSSQTDLQSAINAKASTSSLGSAAFDNRTSFGTRLQGLKADTALQPTGSGASLTGVLKPADVVNNLTSTSTTAPGSAAMLKALQDGKQTRLNIINVKDAPYNAYGDGTNDDTAAIQAAMDAAALGTAQSVVGFPMGTYKITQTLTMGDGSITKWSDKLGVTLVGLTKTTGGVNDPYYPYRAEPNASFPVSILSAVNGPAIKVNGPLTGWGIENMSVRFDNISGASVTGLTVISGQNGTLKNFNVVDIPTSATGIYFDTVPNGYSGYGSANTSWNNLKNITLNMSGNGARGMYWNGQNPHDTMFNKTENLVIIGNHATQTGLHLRAIDNNAFHSTTMYTEYGGTWFNAINFDYTQTWWDQFPSDTFFYGLETGQATIINTGTPSTSTDPYAGATPNIVFGFGQVNEAPIPNIANFKVAGNEAWVSATGGINYADGNVGIGKANPGGKLDVNGTVIARNNLSIVAPTKGQGIILSSNFNAETDTTSTDQQTLKFKRHYDSYDTVKLYTSGLFSEHGYVSSDFRIGMNSTSNAMADALIVKPNGYVGVGASDPTARFQVSQSTLGIGAVSNSAGGTAVTGVNTEFLTKFVPGQSITIGGQTVAIANIASDTSMTTAAITNANTSVVYTPVGGGKVSVLDNGVLNITNPGISGVAIKNSNATFGNMLYAGSSGNPLLLGNWATNSTQSDASKPSWGINMQINNDKMTFQRAPAGSNSFTALQTVHASGGVSIGNTTDPGAANLSVTGTITASNLNLSSGTYNPTVTGPTNLSSTTTGKAMWTRNGSYVTISGTLTVDPTSAGACALYISLPVATTFSAGDQASGVAASRNISGQSGAMDAYSGASAIWMRWTAVDTTSQLMNYTVTYELQ